jgi:hypothetical protein
MTHALAFFLFFGLNGDWVREVTLTCCRAYLRSHPLLDNGHHAFPLQLIRPREDCLEFARGSFNLSYDCLNPVPARL